MKKCIAILSAAALLLSMSACGGAKAPEATTEASVIATEPVTEAPTEGRIDEKESYYLFIPEDWCKLEYAGNNYKIRLFNVSNAPDIEDGKTGEVLIEAVPKEKELADVIAEQMAYEGAKEGKSIKIAGQDFTCITYTYPAEDRAYTVYLGEVDGNTATVMVKGLSVNDPDVQKILKSISFKG